MAFNIQQKGEKWCVYNSDTGELKGEFESRMEAMKRMKELYQEEANEKKNPKAHEAKETKKVESSEGMDD